MVRPAWVFVLTPLYLAACGSMPQDRAISGGGIGAAGGAIIGAVTGLTVVQGALIGTGLGAALGGLTSADKFNLGEPFWRQSKGQQKSNVSNASGGYSGSVATIQRDLMQLGYYPGPIDGVLGPKTRAAIARFETGEGPTLAQNTDRTAVGKDAPSSAAPKHRTN